MGKKLKSDQDMNLIEFAEKLNTNIRYKYNIKLAEYEMQYIVKEMFNLIKEQIIAGFKISFTGFGKFYTSRLKPQYRKAPTVDQPTYVPARNIPKFTAFKSFKNQIARETINWNEEDSLENDVDMEESNYLEELG
jgi:nucleoid DNA-binding protein